MDKYFVELAMTVAVTLASRKTRERLFAPFFRFVRLTAQGVRELSGQPLASLVLFFRRTERPTREALEAAELRSQRITAAVRCNRTPEQTRNRLNRCRDGLSPWISTLTPAEMMIARTHGIRPIATVSATCWLYYGQSWTLGHSEGWGKALTRLAEEAKAAGANAVLDVKMRTVSLEVENSMDFTLVGTAVRFDGLEPSSDPIIATVPALEFVRLLEAGIVPIGLAIGAEYQWFSDSNNKANLGWRGNIESQVLSSLWEKVRVTAHQRLRKSAKMQGASALAHINFSEMFEVERNERKHYLARHIVIATTIDDSQAQIDREAGRLPSALIPRTQIVVDMRAGKSPLTRTKKHHQSYEMNDEEGAI